MIQMALHGEGEPQPTLLQVATQAATIELFTQWQTYRNGVHMTWDTFRSIDFRALAVATLTAAGFDVKMVDATLQLPQLDDDLREVVARQGSMPKPTVYGLDSDAIAKHGEQVQG